MIKTMAAAIERLPREVVWPCATLNVVRHEDGYSDFPYNGMWSPERPPCPRGSYFDNVRHDRLLARWPNGWMMAT